MKVLLKILFLSLIVGIWSCEQDELSEKNYWLYQSGFTPTNGNVKVTELSKNGIKVEIQLKPFISGQYPSHLHFGDILEAGELAVRLNDLDGKSGKSITILKNHVMTNGELLTFQNFLEMNASIRIHSNDPLNRSVVVAYGNVGKNDNYLDAGLSSCIGH